jgi:hypothetical protein
MVLTPESAQNRGHGAQGGPWAGSAKGLWAAPQARLRNALGKLGGWRAGRHRPRGLRNAAYAWIAGVKAPTRPIPGSAKTGLNRKLFDNLVRSEQQAKWNIDSERAGSAAIDGQPELRR